MYKLIKHLFLEVSQGNGRLRFEAGDGWEEEEEGARKRQARETSRLGHWTVVSPTLICLSSFSGKMVVNAASMTNVEAEDNMLPVLLWRPLKSQVENINLQRWRSELAPSRHRWARLQHLVSQEVGHSGCFSSSPWSCSLTGALKPSTVSVLFQGSTCTSCTIFIKTLKDTCRKKFVPCRGRAVASCRLLCHVHKCCVHFLSSPLTTLVFYLHMVHVQHDMLHVSISSCIVEPSTSACFQTILLVWFYSFC